MTSALRVNQMTPYEFFEGRHALRTAFLHREINGDVVLNPVGEDGAFRRYYRLQHEGKNIILMETVPDGFDIATPGHRMVDFIRISHFLRERGLCTPQIYAIDREHGYILLEDFGSISFKAAMNEFLPPRDIYALATDVLSQLRVLEDVPSLALPNYYESHVHTGRRRVVDWFMPSILGAKNADGWVEEYLSIWDEIEAKLPPCPLGFLHIDYHFENLLWRDGQNGLDKCGIIDFQGAMLGPQPYDLANLLEDARVTVPASLRDEMLERFCAPMSAQEAAIFKQWYRVLATQFHCRVIGQFIRMAIRDGKMRYLEMIPRLADYIELGLQDPMLAPLKDWFASKSVDFKNFELPPMDVAARYIRDDAF
jgi:aminoglycoside/choline kinase family phosphotransferase